MLLPLIGTEEMRLLSYGAGLARYQKMEIVARDSWAKTWLDVCVAPAKVRIAGKFRNCSKCWKCRRAMVNFELLDVLDDFSAVFDLASYRRNKGRAVDRILQSAFAGKAADRDLLLLMKQREFPEYTRTRQLRARLRNAIKTMTAR
jgi:hypothetical protein